MKKNLLALVLVLSVVFSATAQQNFAKRIGDQNAKSQLGARPNLEKGQVSTDYNFVSSITDQKNRAALSEGFEGTTFPPEGWAIINSGDPNTWVRYTTTPHTGIASASIVYSTVAHNDYLITPKLAVTALDYTLTAWFKSGSTAYLEPYDVMVSTTGIAAGDFTLLAAAPDPGTTWVQKTYDFSAYAGQNIYVAFRSTTTDQLRLYIDDVAGPAIFTVADDAGVVSIDVPAFILPGDMTPKATVKNYGSTVQDFSVQLKINNGTTDVYTQSLNVTALDPSASLQLLFPNTNAPIGTYTITVTITNPADMDASNDIKVKACTVANLSDAYAGNTTALTYSQLNLATGVFTQVGTIGSAPFPMAEEFNGTSIYRIYNDLTIGTVGGDGSYSYLGTMTGVAGTPTGLAFNWNTNVWYVVVLSAANLPQLCTLNMNTLVLTLVGTGAEGMIIGMDFAWDGFLYGPSLNPDNLYKIDPATGVTTSVGPIGIDINYGQDVSYDGQTGKLYSCTVGAASKFGTYDLSTGAFTEISDNGTSQIATLVITKTPLAAYNVNFTINDGTMPIEGAQIVINDATLMSDAIGNATFTYVNGTYNYIITKFGFADATGSVTIAGANQNVVVSMTALTGYDVTFTVANAIPEVLAGAAVEVSEGVNTFNGVTDASGVYTFVNLPIGTYTYTVSLAGYISGTGAFTVVAAALPVNVTLLEDMVLPFNLAITDDGTDATLVWNVNNMLPLEISQHSGVGADGGYYQNFGKGYGVVYDLSAYPDAVVDKVDFHHVSWGALGTWEYKFHVANMTTSTSAHVTPSYFTTGNDQWELGVDLGAVEGLGGNQVGIFLEPFGNIATDAYPDVNTDGSLQGLSYFAVDLNTFIGTISGTTAGDFIMDLWIITADGAKVKAPRSIVSTKGFTGYNVYLDDLVTPVVSNIAAETYTFLAVPDGEHVAGVRSVYTTGVSDMVTLPWTMGNPGVNTPVSAKANIYPNPTTGKISVANVSNANIYISNIMGNVIAVKENVTGTATFDLSSAAKGIYMVKIVSNNKIITKKVNVIN